MKFRKEDAVAAAAKASFNTATACRCEHDGRLPSHKRPVRERRRPDPLAAIFDAEIVPMLQAAPGLRAVAIFEEMQRRARRSRTGGPGESRTAVGVRR